MCLSGRFPVSNLSDGKWHHVAVSVSAKHLALYVDCSLLETVDWVYHGMGISTDGLLMVGGIIEGFDTPFEVRGSATFLILFFFSYFIFSPKIIKRNISDHWTITYNRQPYHLFYESCHFFHF